MKIKTDNEHKLYIGSDFHFDHDKEFIWGKRGFKNVAEHNERIVKDLQIITPNDDLIYLGDFSLRSTIERTIDFFNKIKARRIYYLNGNHESYTRKVIFDGNQLVHWGNLKEASIDGYHVVFCHFPLAIWNHVGHGALHIHGHCHGSFAAGLPDAKEGKILDVGVEVALSAVNRAFFEWPEVRDILAKKEMVVKDHHNESTT